MAKSIWLAALMLVVWVRPAHTGDLQSPDFFTPEPMPIEPWLEKKKDTPHWAPRPDDLSKPYPCPLPPPPRKPGEVVPILRIAPPYPREALEGGIEGWVRLGVTLRDSGHADTVWVIDAEPKDIFEWAALKAACHFWYDRKTFGADATDARPHETVVTFELDDKDAVKVPLKPVRNAPEAE